MLVRLLLLLALFSQTHVFGQWGTNSHFQGNNKDSMKFIPSSTTSFLGGDKLIVNQSFSVFNRHKWNKKLTTAAYLSTEIFNGGLLPQHQIKSSEGKNFTPYFGRVYSSEDWNFSPNIRIAFWYKIHPKFTFTGGYHTRHSIDKRQSIFRDPSALPTPTLGYSYELSSKLRYVFNLDYANNSGVFGDPNLGKYIATHTVHIDTKYLKFQFFESVVWRRKNENGYRGIEPIYLTPAAIFRPAEFSQGSSDNVLLGAKVDYSCYTRNGRRNYNHSRPLFHLSGEVIIDEFLYKEVIAKNGWWANKHSLQLSLSTSPTTKTNLAITYSHSRPYTYSHSDEYQSFSNGAFSLGNFLGSNYRSIRGSFKYYHKKWVTRSTLQFYRSGEGSQTNNGSDVALSNNSRTSDYNNFIGQGSKGINHYIQNRIVYLVNNESSVFFEHQAHANQHAFGFGYSYSLNSYNRVFF